MLQKINQRLSSIEAKQNDADKRLKIVETEKKSTMDEILLTLRQLQAGPSSTAASSSKVSSSSDMPCLETLQQDLNKTQSESDDVRSKSPIFVQRKRKASNPPDDDPQASKKQKTKHRRARSSTISERQEQRDLFTKTLVTLPDWFPDNWNFAAYITNRFFWVHEAARSEMYSNKKTKGQNYPCYRVPFNNLAIGFVKEYDEERGKLFQAQSSNPDLKLVQILPWYKAYSSSWKRPMIHPRTAKTSTDEFIFHTNITFMDNFLSDIGGEFYLDS